MIAEGTRLSMTDSMGAGDVKPLSSDMVEFGNIYKRRYYCDETVEVAMLFLAPNSKVKRHCHTLDSETYTDVYGNVSEFCAKGQSHSLENTSHDKWLVVLSVKRK